MIQLLRGLVYRMGFRPAPNTIFYSPSRALTLGFKEAVKKMQYPVVLDLGDRPAWQAVSEGIEQMKLEQAERRDNGTPPTLYQSMNFCPMCGSVLVQLVLDVKRCPHSHGKAYTTETTEGLPAIMFEPIGDDE